MAQTRIARVRHSRHAAHTFTEIQIRGGRKGVLPACELHARLATRGSKLETGKENGTTDEEVDASPKHSIVQAVIDPQSAMGLSQRQQSDISSTAHISADVGVIADDFSGSARPPAAGSMATDNTIRSARILRPISMAQWKVADLPARRDKFVDRA